MIQINLEQAKTIAHDMRREQRSQEFDPLDQLLVKQIPGTDIAAVESARQAVRDKYTQIQLNIDSAPTAAVLLDIVNTLKQG